MDKKEAFKEFAKGHPELLLGKNYMRFMISMAKMIELGKIILLLFLNLPWELVKLSKISIWIVCKNILIPPKKL